jgi:energy-coupling factor transporter transmembrane protein EcfT
MSELRRQLALSSNNFIMQDALFLQPPPGKRYVRSFLFSRRIDAPFARVHLIARVILIMCLSIAQLRTIDTLAPDPIGAGLLWVVSALLFLTSGMNMRVARLYVLLTIPALFSLFLTWTLFNPVPGKIILTQWLIYSGQLALGLAAWQAIWLVIVVGYFLWTRKFTIGILLATAVVLLLPHFVALPEWTIAHVPFFHPLTMLISDRGLLVAVTKVIGYSGMVFSTIALVVTGRDAELIGTLRQLRLPQPVIFFLSTVFRALDLALADYETIRQAQIARAINARPKSFFRLLRDLASIAVPLVAMMIRRSSEIGDALLARGYTLGRSSADFYETSPWRLIDWLILAFSLVLLYLAIGPHLNFTTLVQKWF